MDKYSSRKVVLVDENDRELEACGLIEAHRDGGKKHRAFSLVLYRKSGDKVEVLLQRRAMSKPVFPGLWANTCCYNLAPGEEYLGRVRSRAKEELGIDLEDQPLSLLYRFSYEAEDQDGWWENEWDQIIIGEWDPTSSETTRGHGGRVMPNPEEAMDYKWIEWREMKEWMARVPDIFAPWWKMIVNDSRMILPK